MTFQQPAWTPAEPGAPVALPTPQGSEGRVVVVVASEGAFTAGWAGEVAVDLAKGWSASGARVVLADGGLTHPQLHTTLSLPLGEGLVDALRWGASVKRVAHRPDGTAFYAVTAGTAVADAAAVFEDPRWPALCAGFREAGVTLVVLVPSHDPARDGVLAQADHAVVLSGPGEDAADVLGSWEGDVLAVTGREDTASSTPTLEEPVSGDETAFEEPASDEAGVEEAAVDEAGLGEPTFAEATLEESVRPEAAVAPGEPTSSEEPLFLEDPLFAEGPLDSDGAFRAEEPALDQEPISAEEPRPDEPPVPSAEDEATGEETFKRTVPEPEPPFREPEHPPVPTFEEIVEDADYQEATSPARSGRTRLLLLLLLLVVVGGVVAAWLGYVEIPGITPMGTGAAEAPAAVAPTLASQPPTDASAPQAFSLALGAFQDETTARALALDFSGKVPGVLFVTAPVSVQGAVVHRVLAGPASDSLGAVSVAERVGEATGLDPAAWVARRTPLAFQLGEMPEMEAARRRADVLVGLGVPAYVLAVSYSDGSTRFRVYAGAYADAGEASYLSALLEERGLSSASLSDRTGRLPE